MTNFDYEDNYWDEYDASMPDPEDYPEDDYEEDWDALECGFNPYMGCYDYDC